MKMSISIAMLCLSAPAFICAAAFLSRRSPVFSTALFASNQYDREKPETRAAFSLHTASRGSGSGERDGLRADEPLPQGAQCSEAGDPENLIEALLMAPFGEEDMAWASAVPGYRFTFGGREPTEAQLASAEVILGQPSLEQLNRAGRLNWLQAAYAGMDGYAGGGFPAGVTLTNVTGAFGRSISEFVLAMVLTLYKKLHLYRDHQRICLWQDERRQESPEGKNLLILGAGDIGCAVARMFRPFHCHIVGVRRVPRALPPEFDEMLTLDELEPALRQADIVVGALPSTPATVGLLDRRRLNLLKPSAIVVNVGRGSLIDCDALAEKLAAGELSGAALDVTEPEPLPVDHPLWRCENALITPHTTGGSFGRLRDTTEKIIAICRENLERYREGKPLKNLVDLSIGYRKTAE